MGRGGISVSRVTVDQEQRLAPLWVAARTAAGQSADWADRAVREGRVRSALEREDVRVYLAERDGQECAEGHELPVRDMQESLGVT